MAANALAPVTGDNGDMSTVPAVTRTTGWVFVIAQFTILGALVFLPAAPTEALPPAGRWLAVVLLAVGGGLVVAALIQLGRAATATPVPNSSGVLRTSGLYRSVRHPIYSGLFVIAAGLALSGMTLGHVILAVAFVILMNTKARFEEALLTQKFPEYPEYAQRTGRFIPRLPRG
ncbi:MAG: hypothetical protein RIS25_1210 [Actinomycetota bacterium]|jgi:protein-S-isoprenylcysteine O-methyltransferase Ste14